jgi:hypothetical protein
MKLFKLIVIGFIMMLLLVSCAPEKAQVIGSFLEITVTGTYFNELTGEITAGTEELKAVINLYPIDEIVTKSGRVAGGGYFPPGPSSGILYSSSTGFDATAPIMTGSGTAHVNGFIAKGPFSEGSEIKVTLIDENYNRIEIPTDFITALQGASDTESEFSINLPASEDVDIKININALTFIQTARMDELIKNQGKTFYEAYIQSKQEILNIVNVQDSISEIGDFETMDIRQDNDTNSILLLANSLLAGTEPVTKNGTSLLKNVYQLIKNHGAIINENIADLLVDKFDNLDIANIRANLGDYFGGGAEIPNPQDFLDDDGDGIINRYDITLLNPVGQVIIDPLNTPDATFRWTKMNIPDMGNIEYKLEISNTPLFLPDVTETFTIDNPTAGTEVTFDQYGDPAILNTYRSYYWRVKGIVNGIEKRWLASSSFYIVDTFGSSEPFGDLNLLTPDYSTSRQVIIDNSSIHKASEMRFSINNELYEHPQYGQWSPFELIRRIILPEAGTYTIYAQFKNSTGTMSYTPTVEVNINPTAQPTGSFLINNGAENTVSRSVYLNMADYQDYDTGTTYYGIKYAFKMRFGNSQAEVNNAPWIPFRKNLVWNLDVNEDTVIGPEEKTVFGQFINSNGTISIEKNINYIKPIYMNLYVGQGVKVSVTQYLDPDPNSGGDALPDFERTFFPRVNMQTPYRIRTKTGASIDLYAEVIDPSYEFIGFFDAETGGTPYPGENLNANFTVEGTNDFYVYALTTEPAS